jgi:hypothetical protein
MSEADSVYEWEVYCTTENQYKYTWSPFTPTVCPTNASHPISSNPKIIRSISDTMVKIKEEDKYATQGIYQFRCYHVDIPESDAGNVYSFDMTWPRPVTLMTGWFYSTECNIGDILNANVTATVGAIVAPLYTNTSIITTTSTVFENLYQGYSVHVTDLTNFDTLGEALTVDSANSQVICEKPSSHTYSPLSPTYVQMTSRVIRDMYIPVGNQRYAFAEKKIGGRSLPANIPITLNYTNNSGNAKTFTYYVEILY